MRRQGPHKLFMPLIRPLAGAAFWSNYKLLRQLAIWLVATLLLGAVWLHTWGLIEEDRTRDLANAEKDITNLARLSQEHAERTMHSVDQTLRMVLSQYQEHKGQIDLKRMSAHGVFDSRVLFQLLNAYLYKLTRTESRVLNWLAMLALMAPINLAGVVLGE